MKFPELAIKVAAFLVIGFLCFGYISFKLGKIDLLGGYYTISAQFDSVTGLRPGNPVEMAGVDVGKVDRISLNPINDSEAVVEMKIKKSVRITDDVIASIHTSGIVGDKFVSLAPGGSTRYLSNNGKIRDTESSVDVLSLISKYLNSKGK